MKDKTMLKERGNEIKTQRREEEEEEEGKWGKGLSEPLLVVVLLPETGDD